MSIETEARMLDGRSFHSFGPTGNDFFEDFDVQLKFGKSLMQIDKHKTRLIRHESSNVARIRLGNTCIIPADSEMTINANIDGLFF